MTKHIVIPVPTPGDIARGSSALKGKYAARRQARKAAKFVELGQELFPAMFPAPVAETVVVPTEVVVPA